MKIGRNQTCPCKSGLKYKKCCGYQNKEPANLSKHHKKSISSGVTTMIKRREADELIRQQQQGLGRPIVTTEFKEGQIVAVGSTIYKSPERKWKTFPDFLSDYLKTILGAEWGSAEIEKPLEDRHIILQWYHEYCYYQENYIGDSKEIKSTPFIGIIYCYMGLAYNLYLLQHNVELQARFIKRLKDIKNFQGAYYELIVANCLLRAGFELDLEDEADLSSKHCEFSAISKKTGKKYWVEAKMRGVSGYLGKTDKDGTDNPDPTCMLSKHISDALKKPAKDERLIFVDLNGDPHIDDSRPRWVDKAGKKMDMRERDLMTGQCAYVFVTNMSFHRTLDSDSSKILVLAHGLGISDFAKPGHYRLSEIYKNKQKHIDSHEILEAIGKYPNIPSTFDGTIPSETFNEHSQRILIGEKYFFDDIGDNGVIGTVTSATVNEPEKKAYFAIYTENKKSLIMTKEMSDIELADYRKHPEAFWGTIQEPPRKTNNTYELFEFFMDSYRNTSKERILELMEKAPDIDSLREMQHSDLVLEYCERLVASSSLNKST